MAPELNTRVYRNIRNDWNAVTRVPLGGDDGQRVLIVETMKDSNGWLTTVVRCARMEQHGEATNLFGDYWKTVARDKVRCTEQHVRLQHRTVLEQLPQIREHVAEYYRNKKPAAIVGL